MSDFWWQVQEQEEQESNEAILRNDPNYEKWLLKIDNQPLNGGQITTDMNNNVRKIA